MIFMQITDSLPSTAPIVSSSSGIVSNVWFWIALIEFLIIMLSVIISIRDKNKKWEKLKFKQGISDSNTEFIFPIGDMFRAPEMYKKLMRVCHPDRFIDETKKNAAEELCMLIGKNQYNVTEMERLGKLAEEKLEIKIF